jgi:hypothetical protein
MKVIAESTELFDLMLDFFFPPQPIYVTLGRQESESKNEGKWAPPNLL